MGYGSDSDSDEEVGGTDYVPPGSMAPLLRLGDALVYDQRTVSRGTCRALGRATRANVTRVQVL